jgi:hypothetical protein
MEVVMSTRRSWWPEVESSLVQMDEADSEGTPFNIDLKRNKRSVSHLDRCLHLWGSLVNSPWFSWRMLE